MTAWQRARRTLHTLFKAVAAPSSAGATAGGPLAMAAAAAPAARALSAAPSRAAAAAPALHAAAAHAAPQLHPPLAARAAGQPARRPCIAAAAAGGAPGAGAGGSPPPARRQQRGAAFAADGDLRTLPGVGPVNKDKLQQGGVLNVQALQAVYAHECDRDVERLVDHLQGKFSIRRLHGRLIAEEVRAMAAEAERAAAERADAQEGGRLVVTLAVEGNISAGKSTFLDVLSHEETNLRHILKVVQEPVSDWQRFKCADARGEERVQNVLEKFYSDPQRYAYSFQHYVLMSRMQKDRATRAPDKDLRVVERSIFSDRQVFVRAMHRAGTMEDFEVSVYNSIFDKEVTTDLQLVPDGFVYLRAAPGTCMQRMRRRNRGEEGGVSQAYLEELHANHEDWLADGDSAGAILRQTGASVLTPAPEAALQRFLEGYTPGREVDRWKLEVLSGVPDAIKDQVLLLKGAEGLPQLQHRLALVMDHDRDVDVHNDVAARREYAAKIQTFYQFVRQWKQEQLRAEAELEAIKAEIAAGVQRGGDFAIPRSYLFAGPDGLGNYVGTPAEGGGLRAQQQQMSR